MTPETVRAQLAEINAEIDRLEPPPAPTRATERPAKPAGALTPAPDVCEPGCGRSFAGLGALSRHRAGCNFWLTYRAEHVREVPTTWPAPVAADPEPDHAFEERRAEAAAAAAAKTWAERHPGEAPRPLTARQIKYLDALRAAKGDGAAAARAVGISNSGGIAALVADLRRDGRLPADVEALLEARKAERAGATP